MLKRDSAGGKSPCHKSEAFPNESISCEAVTGRYLKQGVRHLDERARAKRRSYTTMPLNTTKKVVRVIVSIVSP